MFVRNRITGGLFRATPILLARAERDKDFELVDDAPKPAPKPEPEPTQPVAEHWIDGKLNVNLATPELIASTARGIGLATARSIVKRVEVRGPFESLDELTAVSGVGKATVERNRDNLTV